MGCCVVCLLSAIYEFGPGSVEEAPVPVTARIFCNMRQVRRKSLRPPKRIQMSKILEAHWVVLPLNPLLDPIYPYIHMYIYINI